MLRRLVRGKKKLSLSNAAQNKQKQKKIEKNIIRIDGILKSIVMEVKRKIYNGKKESCF